MVQNKTLIIIVSVFLIILITSISIFFFGFRFQSNSTSKSSYHTVIIKNGDKSRELKVEFAEKFDDQTKGLMNRKSLDGIDGMLFIFSDEQYQSFWMKNTYIPLDIIYFNSSKNFTNIQRNAQPCLDLGDNCPTYSSNGKIKYVLETESNFLSDDLVSNNTTFEIKE